MTLTTEWNVPSCEKPTAIVINSADKLLYLACRRGQSTKPAFMVLSLENGAVVYSSEIGDGADGIIYDAISKRIFIACGVNATLSVFAVESAPSYKPVETLATRQWVKVLAYDAQNQKLYSMAAEGSADAGKKINTAVSPFYPNTVFPGTFTVLSYAK